MLLLHTHLLPLLPHALTISSLALHLPPTQPITPNTLLSSLHTSNYAPQCQNILNPPQPPLNPTACGATIQPACKKLVQTTSLAPRDRWIWAEPDEQQGCALGWYLPAGTTVPHAMDCFGAFKAIVDECAGKSGFNAGSVNVKQMPSVIFGPGTAVEEAEMRWVMAPQQLTR